MESKYSSLSIITVTLNNYDGLRRTLNSLTDLLCNSDVNLELIVVDGKSKEPPDELVDGIRHRYKRANLRVVMISEPDQGIYDAMNKGVALANATWCLFINSGDELFSSESVTRLLECDDGTFDYIYGDCVVNNGSSYWLVEAMSDSMLVFNDGMPFCHPSCLMKRSRLVDDPYSKSFKSASDYLHFARASKMGARFKYVPVIVSIFEEGGLSSSPEALREKIRIESNLGYISQPMRVYRCGSIAVKTLIKSILPRTITQQMRIARNNLSKSRHFICDLDQISGNTL